MSTSHAGNIPAEGSAQLTYGGRRLPATRGKRLLDVILEAGIDHRHICGGRGFCTSCRIEVLEGGDNLSPVSTLEKDRLGPEAGRLRLACQTYLHGPAAVRVPPPRPSRFSPDGES